MPTVETSLRTMDALGGQLVRNAKQMDVVTAAATRLNHEMGSGRNLLMQVNQQQKIISNTQQQFNDEVKKGGRDWSGMFAKLRSAGGALSGFFRTGAATVDEFVNSGTRLSLVNDGSQSTPELRDKVFAAAGRSRGSFGAMANTVSQLGLLAPGAFGDNNEMIAFAELMQKSFKVGGASPQDQQAGMDQITQAMASGQLQGGALQSLTATAPALTQAIADFTGQSVEGLLAMGSEGTTAADTIKGALFAAANDINAKFEETPRTFGDVFTLAGDRALQAFSPLMDAISGVLQSGTVDQLLNGLTAGLQMLGSAALNVFNFLISNMDIVKFALIAIGTVAIAFGINWLAAWMAAIQPLLVIIAVITGIMFILNKLGVSTGEIVGFITGVFYTFFAFLWNRFAFIWNRILAFAEFLVNVFIDPLYAIEKLFYDLAKNALDYVFSLINGITSGINWLIGKFNELTGSEIGMIGKLDSSFLDQDKPSSNKNVVDFSKYRMEMKDLGEAFDKGYDKGSGFVSKMSSLTDVFQGIGSSGNLLGANKGSPNGSVLGSGMNAGSSNANINKVNEVGKINNTVDISSEDLKVMRELAEMKNIQNFVTLTPSFSFGDTHVRQEGRSVDEIIANISDKLNDAIASGAQGVYS